MPILVLGLSSHSREYYFPTTTELILRRRVNSLPTLCCTAVYGGGYKRRKLRHQAEAAGAARPPRPGIAAFDTSSDHSEYGREEISAKGEISGEEDVDREEEDI